MNTYYFSVVAINHFRKLEVRRCVVIRATHYDLAELHLIEQHMYIAVDPRWIFSAVQITDKHYETLNGVLELNEVAA